MTKRKPTTETAAAAAAAPEEYVALEAARGSYIGASGRVRYEVEPGPLSTDDLEAETLARLIRLGVVVGADKPVPAEEPAPAESEEGTS